DAVLRALRSTQPDPPTEKKALTTLLAALSPPAAGSAPAEPAPASGPAPAGPAPLGDLSGFRKITQDTLTLLNAGNQAGATARITALETSWDNSEARLKPRNTAAWTEIDGKIDTVLRQLRSASPKPAAEKAALTDLLTTLEPVGPGPAAPRPTAPVPAAPTGHASALGDLSGFRKITQDTLTLLNAGNQAGATARITALETSWDNSEARLKPRNTAAWTEIDGKID